MEENWRYTAQSVTKYNPVFRDQNGFFQTEEWVGFFQVGSVISGKKLTFEDYAKVENKYITAAKWFFSFHRCEQIRIVNLEKPEEFSYTENDRQLLEEMFSTIKENCLVKSNDIATVMKLILREIVSSSSDS